MTADSVPTEPPAGQQEFPPITDDTAASADAAVSPRRSRGRKLLFLALILLVVATVGSFVVPTPYYLFAPGRLRSTAAQVDISGADRFDSDGDIFFTTIRLDQATLAGLVRGAVDEAVEVRSREEVAPGGDVNRSRQENRVRMDVSKTIAERVALEYLGYRVSDGVEVVSVQDGGPSDGRLHPGDLITEVDGVAVSGERDLRRELADRRPGEVVRLRVNSVVDGTGTIGETAAGLAPDAEPERRAPESVEVTLGSAADPRDPARTRPVIGIVPITHEIEQLPVDVQIDSGEVGGPSAGLAFTLTVVDLLTEGDMTKRREVAVTGQINRDGSVGRIGGLLQKASAALRRGDVQVMLYPAETPQSEADAVRRLVDGRFELHPVQTIDEAVEILNGSSLRP